MSRDAKRYFIGSDNDGHYYLVDASRRAEWERWTNLSSDDEASWDVPLFARRIDGPHSVTFTSPQEDHS